jgi:hypothetical protein
MNRVVCNTCGGKVDVPPGHTRAKIRCINCGYYADVPPELRRQPDDEPAFPEETPSARRTPSLASDPDPLLQPAPTRLKTSAKQTDSTAIPPLLEGTQDDDDDRPYTVPGDPTKKCPACRKELPRGAEFCIHCGADLTAGQKKKREYQPVDRTWESVASLSLRIKAFLVIQVANVLMVVNILATGYNSVAIGTVAFNVFLQAFLLGTYDTLRVRRNVKGAAKIIKQWRICFLPQPTITINWKKSHGVGIVAIHNPGCLEYALLLIILFFGFGQMSGWILSREIDSMYMWLVTALFVFPVSFAPAAAWYWFAICPERFLITLCDEYGSTDDVLFRTTHRQTAEEVCETTAETTGLMYRKVM